MDEKAEAQRCEVTFLGHIAHNNFPFPCFFLQICIEHQIGPHVV